MEDLSCEYTHLNTKPRARSHLLVQCRERTLYYNNTSKKPVFMYSQNKNHVTHNVEFIRYCIHTFCCLYVIFAYTGLNKTINTAKFRFERKEN